MNGGGTQYPDWPMVWPEAAKGFDLVLSDLIICNAFVRNHAGLATGQHRFWLNQRREGSNIVLTAHVWEQGWKQYRVVTLAPVRDEQAGEDCYIIANDTAIRAVKGVLELGRGLFAD